MVDSWDATRYDTFAAARTAPFRDLLDLLQPMDAPFVADLGCGSGRLTHELAMRTGARRVIGMDSSLAMLSEATDDADAGDAGCEFVLGDIGADDLGARLGAPLDIVASNAALQWVPDHVEALVRWTDLVGPGGQIAVQVPANGDHPSHLLADEVAAEPDMAARFHSPPPTDPTREIRRPAEYAELLFDRGFGEPRVRTQIYPVIMESTRSVVQWLAGTSLTRFRSRLDETDYLEFEARYEERFVAAVGDRSPYFFAFPRILMWGGNRRA